jgi:hypothetical protein
MDIRSQSAAPMIGVVFVSGLGLSALSYTNGYSLLTAAAVGTATAAVGLWAIITEP